MATGRVIKNKGMPGNWHQKAKGHEKETEKNNQDEESTC